MIVFHSSQINSEQQEEYWTLFSVKQKRKEIQLRQQGYVNGNDQSGELRQKLMENKTWKSSRTKLDPRITDL